MNGENQITLYPSNWLYNAGVVGFLRVLEEINKKYKCEEFVEIKLDGLDDEEIFKKWDEITKKNLRISYEGKGGGTQKYYYSNQTEKSIKDKISTFIGFQKKQQSRRKTFTLNCHFCGEAEETSKSEIKVLKQTFGNILLASEKTFPNTYWMMESREFVCSKCQFILMCHHIPFITFEEKNSIEIFINTPYFNITRDLNKFAEQILQMQKKYQLRKLLGTSLLQWAIKRRALLGAWTMMNIEVVIKRSVRTAPNKSETIIDYFDLPYHITKILLDWEIADLINRIGEEKIFDLVLNGKFSELEKANYFVLRAFLKLKNNEKLNENDPVTNYVNNYLDITHLLKISNLLPELYAKIIKILKTEVKYG
ncbi:MAG: Cas8a1 family CRISPR/Cas system-associated protein [Candidatus Ratteibacteria bacterium]